MDFAEQEHLVEELELRVERLRALYDQYFMGIEKVEPLVLRKDVDRRLWVLRREQIRNTGLRFKLQQVVSRYNTFSMYWQRIIREIENGTYKRDVAKAAKRFGTEPLTIAAKRRLGKRDLEKVERAVAEDTAAPSPADCPSRDEADGGDPPTSPFRRDELAALEQAAAAAPSAPPLSGTRPGAAPARSRAPVQRLELDDDDELFAGLDLGKSVARGLAPTATGRPSPEPPAATAPSAPVPPPARASSPELGARAPAPRAPVPAPRGSAPVPVPRASAPVPAPSAPPGARPPVPAGAPPAPTAPARPLLRSSLATNANPFGSPGAARERPAPPAGAPPSSQNRPVPPPPQEPSRAAPAPARPAGRSDGDDARMREIYAQYVEAKRKCNEPTTSLSYDTLAKSIRDSKAKLGAKHAGKAIDFDVVIKDGKAVLRPILKG